AGLLRDRGQQVRPAGLREPARGEAHRYRVAKKSSSPSDRNALVWPVASVHGWPATLPASGVEAISTGLEHAEATSAATTEHSEARIMAHLSLRGRRPTWAAFAARSAADVDLGVMGLLVVAQRDRPA